MAQSVEHVIGNDEVTGPIPVTSSKNSRMRMQSGVFTYYFITLHSSLIRRSREAGESKK